MLRPSPLHQSQGRLDDNMTETLRNSYEEDLDEERELREAARLMGQGEKGGQREAAAIPVSAGPQRVVIPAVIMIREFYPRRAGTELTFQLSG